VLLRVQPRVDDSSVRPLFIGICGLYNNKKIKARIVI
jgi:hypothetical protein